MLGSLSHCAYLKTTLYAQYRMTAWTDPAGISIGKQTTTDCKVKTLSWRVRGREWHCCSAQGTWRWSLRKSIEWKKVQTTKSYQIGPILHWWMLCGKSSEPIWYNVLWREHCKTGKVIQKVQENDPIDISFRLNKLANFAVVNGGSCYSFKQCLFQVAKSLLNNGDRFL